MAEWHPGAAWPLPGPGVPPDELVALLAGTGEWELTQRSGVVAAAALGATSDAAALLARATGRDLIHLTDNTELPVDGPVALVGRADQIRAPWWDSDRVGVVTGRTDAEVNFAVLKALKSSGAPARDLVYVFPGGPGAASADGTTVREVANTGSVRFLTLRTHGRSCCAVFPDGLICGRVEYDLGTSVPIAGPARRLPPCVQGGSCFRDLTSVERRPARKLEADVVLLESCRAYPTDPETEPHEVSLGLSVFSGRPRLVIAARGNHAPTAATSARVREALLAGATALEAVARGTAGEGADEMSRLGILGDPSQVVVASPASTAPSSTSSAINTAALVAPPTVLTNLLGFDAISVLDLGVQLRGEALATQAKAVWRQQQRARATGIVPTNTASERLTSDYRALLADAAREIGERIFLADWSAPVPRRSEVNLESSRATTCPNCDRQATDQVYRSRLDDRVGLTGTICRACGDVLWRAAAGVPALALAPFQDQTVSAAQLRTTLTFEVSNLTGDPIDVAACFAFGEAELQGLPSALAPREMRIDPHDSVTVRFNIAVGDDTATADQHRGWFVVLGAGTALFRAVWMNVRPPEG